MLSRNPTVRVITKLIKVATHPQNMAAAVTFQGTPLNYTGQMIPQNFNDKNNHNILKVTKINTDNKKVLPYDFSTEELFKDIEEQSNNIGKELKETVTQPPQRKLVIFKRLMPLVAIEETKAELVADKLSTEKTHKNAPDIDAVNQVGLQLNATLNFIVSEIQQAQTSTIQNSEKPASISVESNSREPLNGRSKTENNQQDILDKKNTNTKPEEQPPESIDDFFTNIESELESLLQSMNEEQSDTASPAKLDALHEPKERILHPNEFSDPEGDIDKLFAAELSENDTKSSTPKGIHLILENLTQALYQAEVQLKNTESLATQNPDDESIDQLIIKIRDNIEMKLDALSDQIEIDPITIKDDSSLNPQIDTVTEKAHSVLKEIERLATSRLQAQLKKKRQWNRMAMSRPLIPGKLLCLSNQ